MVESALETPVAVTGDKEKVAARLITAWCAANGYEPQDIPGILERNPKNAIVGTLVYAIRTHAGLDPTPAAGLLGIHTGNLLTAMVHARHQIDTLQSDRDTARLKKLLATADVLGSEKDGAATGGDAVAARRARLEVKLHKEAPDVIRKVLECLEGAMYEDVTGSSPAREATHARYIATAILYHLVLESQYQVILAGYLKKTPNIISKVLAVVHDELRRKMMTPFKAKILRVCTHLKFDPNKL